MDRIRGPQQILDDDLLLFERLVILKETPHLAEKVRRFFEDYKKLEQKEVVVEDMLGPEEALQIIREALELYRKLRRGQLT